MERVRNDASSLFSEKILSPDDFSGSPKSTFVKVLQAVNLSYKAFISYFEQLEYIGPHEFIIAVNFVHGWKSDKLMYGSTETNDLRAIAAICSRAKLKERISRKDLGKLTRMCDNCFSTASKLLHLINPTTYAILDKHVYKYLYGLEWDDITNATGVDECFKYWDLCAVLSQSEEASQLCSEISAWLGYEVSNIRALEIVMFISGKLASIDKPALSASA